MNINDQNVIDTMDKVIELLRPEAIVAMDWGSLKSYQIDYYKSEIYKLRSIAFDIKDQVRRDYVWTNRTIS